MILNRLAGEDRLSKRAWKAEESGRRRRGRPKLRQKDCVKRDRPVRTAKSGRPSQKTEGDGES